MEAADRERPSSAEEQSYAEQTSPEEGAAREALAASIEAMLQRVQGPWSLTADSPCMRPVEAPAGSGQGGSPWHGSAADVGWAAAPSPGATAGSAGSPALLPTGEGHGATTDGGTSPWLITGGSSPGNYAGSAPTEDLDDYTGSSGGHSTPRRPEAGGPQLSAADLEGIAELREALVAHGGIVSGAAERPQFGPGLAPLMAPPPAVPHSGLGAQASDPEITPASPRPARGGRVAWGAPLVTRLVEARESGPGGSGSATEEGGEWPMRVQESVSAESDVPPLPQVAAAAVTPQQDSPAAPADTDASDDLPFMLWGPGGPGDLPPSIAVELTRSAEKPRAAPRDSLALGKGFREAASALGAGRAAHSLDAPHSDRSDGSHCTEYLETWDVAMTSYDVALKARAEMLERRMEAGAAGRPTAVSGGAPTPRVSIGAPPPLLSHRMAGGAARPGARTAAVRSFVDKPWADGSGRTRRVPGKMPQEAVRTPAPKRKASGGERHVWSADMSARSCSVDIPEVSPPMPSRPSVDPAEPMRPVPVERPGKVARIKAKMQRGLRGLLGRKSFG